MKTFSKSIFVLGLAAFFGFNTATAQEFFAPSEVQNVVATPGIGEITLSWDAATDEDGVVTGYKIYYGTSSVQTEDDAYDDEISLPVQTSVVLKNLENGVKYFLTVTAIDDEENESETYSAEISVLLNVDRAPRIVSIKNVSETELEIEMSKKMAEVPFPEAFLIEKINDDEKILLTIISAKTNETKISIKTSDPFITGQKYLVTASSAIEDAEGNPVASGVTDHLEFVAEEIIVVVEPEPAPVVEPEPIIVEEEPGIFGPGREDLPHEAAPLDETAPIDATDFVVDSTRLKLEKVIVLNWKQSLDLDEDVADQVLYTKVGLGEWDTGFSIGKSLSSIEVDVEPEQTYEIKLVIIDESGNESIGISTSFSTKLAKSGSGGFVIAISVAILIGFMVVAGRRKTALQ